MPCAGSTLMHQGNPLQLVSVQLPGRPLGVSPACPVPWPPRNRSSASPFLQPPSLQKYLATMASSCLQGALAPPQGSLADRSKQELQPAAFLSCTHPPINPPAPTTPATRAVGAQGRASCFPPQQEMQVRWAVHLDPAGQISLLHLHSLQGLPH